MSPFIYALDFDGVICDSVEESSKTALMAAKSQWPHLALPSTCADDFPPQLLSALCVVRPVVETGFEYVLLARLCAEIKADCLDEEFVQPVLRDWATLRDEAMERWDVSRDDLVNTFGSARDRWIAQDEDSWAVSNKMYVGNLTILC